jgi:hypothetical protein
MDITGCSAAELVGDPLIALVMKRDGVDRGELRLLLERVASERSHATGLFPLSTMQTAPCSHC